MKINKCSPLLVVVQHWSYQNISPRSIPYHSTITGPDPKMVLYINIVILNRPEVG